MWEPQLSLLKQIQSNCGMWKLKTGAETVREERNNNDESGGSTGSETWLRTLNGHLGRQVWEFHPELGTPEELQQIEDARRGFSDRRFEKRHSSDLLMRIQVWSHVPTILNLFNFSFFLACFSSMVSMVKWVVFTFVC